MGVQEQEQLWGGETTKAIGNFPISGETVPAGVIHWLGRIKGAAARVNAELQLLDPLFYFLRPTTGGCNYRRYKAGRFSPHRKAVRQDQNFGG